MSILLSVYNAGPYLADSAQSILEQTYRDFELIIIDDASTDGSSEILDNLTQKDPRIKLMRNPENQGLTKSLNRGLREASGEFIARQDADDISFPMRLEKQVAAMDANPELGLLGTGLIELDAQGRRGPVSLQPSLKSIIRRKMLFDNAFFHSSVIWRNDIFQKFDLAYNNDLRYGQDYDLFSCAVWQVETANLPEPLILFRMHSGQVSKQHVEDQQSLADKVSWRNFISFGLQKEFDQKDVALMRRLGIRAGNLNRQAKRRQWHLWRKLFSLLEADLAIEELIEWKQVKQTRLKLLRRTLATYPPLLAELADLLAMDPWGAAKDLAGVLRNRLYGKGA